jgi:hypothetical protein
MRSCDCLVAVCIVVLGSAEDVEQQRSLSA